jgi:hypothetical protein
MSLLDRVREFLEQQGISYALVGAAALAARGVARSTLDIDLLTTDTRALNDGLWTDLRAAGASIDVRRGDADDPLAGVVRVDLPADRPVDLIVGRHAWQARAVERAERMSDGLPVVDARDLILLKLYAGGTQDLWDIRELLRLPGRKGLVNAVAADLVTLPVAMRDLWVSAQAGE